MYVLARRVLLDALDALATQRGAVILVGAQAIYLHTGEGDLAVPPFTLDGDLGLDPDALRAQPKLGAMLTAAGFHRTDQPGIWGTTRPLGRTTVEVTVDLLVPDRVGGPGRRGARLGPHGNWVARKVRGLEAVLVDRAPRMIAALAPDDRRRIEVAVTGPAALLVAKLHKITEQEVKRRRTVRESVNRSVRAHPARTA